MHILDLSDWFAETNLEMNSRQGWVAEIIVYFIVPPFCMLPFFDEVFFDDFCFCFFFFFFSDDFFDDDLDFFADLERRALRRRSLASCSSWALLAATSC
uniref:Uncharacterized protein n=1 Tax=Romanomermis culicivorax TaxID=13658 RepID=A0A915JW39_ROMCU